AFWHQNDGSLRERVRRPPRQDVRDYSEEGSTLLQRGRSTRRFGFECPSDSRYASFSIPKTGSQTMTAIIELWSTSDQQRLERFIEAVAANDALATILALNTGDVEPIREAIQQIKPMVQEAE